MLDYGKYISVADRYQRKARYQDREDLNHTIILSLAQALRACGGMVEFKLTSPSSPMLFSANGYQLVVMPMMTNEASEQSKRDTEVEGEATTTEQAEPTAEVETEPEPVTEPVAQKPKKARRSRKAKEAVTV